MKTKLRTLIATTAACLAATLLTACGSSASATFPTTASATKYWDAQISKLAHGTMARNDGRGCAKTGAQQYSCAGYLRDARDSLSSGENMIGVVIVEGAHIHVAAHPASNAAMNHWLHRYRHVRS